MTEKRFFILVLCITVLSAALPAQAGFPFSFRKPTIRTDYSQTVWDQIMQEQAVSDIRRGMGEMAQAQYSAASNSFAKAVIKNAKNPLGYLLLGASLYWAGKVDDAISEYKEALILDPNNAMAYQLLGIAAGWKGDVTTAQNYFLKANALDPNKADTHMNLGSTYAVQHNLDKALEHFRRSTELAPREPLYHYQLGTLYEALGRDEQAEESFKRALHYFSAYEDAQLSLGALYEKMGQPEQALKFYKKAVKTKPGDYVARLRYAFLLVRQGQEQKAREVIEESFSIAKFNDEGLALNAVYRASGRTAQAFEKQINEFAESLGKVSPAKPVQIEVALEYDPETPPAPPSKGKGNSFEQVYQQMRATGVDLPGQLNKRTFQRTFTLPATDRTSREQQINDFISGVRQAVAQGEDKYQVNLSLQGRTADYAAPGAITQTNTTTPKAVYDPRVVGNDMGLWVMGRSWLKFVDETAEDLQEYTCLPGNMCLLLKGLSSLARGEAGSAQVVFEQASESAPKDVLPLLGRGTAAVIAGEDELARRYYEQALTLQPGNKTASRNLKILAE